MKVKMIKTVFDGKIYHRAGEEVDVTNDVAKWYSNKGFASEVKIDEPTIEIVESKEEKIEIETKEEKKVYKRNTKAEIEDATDSDN